MSFFAHRIGERCLNYIKLSNTKDYKYRLLSLRSTAETVSIVVTYLATRPQGCRSWLLINNEVIDNFLLLSEKYTQSSRIS